ncbi:MAG TPA: hypothetical protein ENJ50_05795 [Planctomycetaceae bacterium]|nr:hypothetical protein [Planctomycetaceae bacterium]
MASVERTVKSVRAAQDGRGITAVRFELPRGRVPASFVIDDSTCLVNMGYYCMPQFAAAWPNRPHYKKPWKKWPREIPDAFVREFGEWCAEHGVKGKYSIVPYPACVGWLDRLLPGWSRRELLSSLKLVRELMLPNWDIHPEMITHTRVIDLKTGRPMEKIHSGTMENTYPQEKKSVDELASYLAYALKILKNCDLPCEGVTTPGGFGNRVKQELSAAVGEAVRDVFGTELPHYFKYVAGRDESTVPRLENVEDGRRDLSRAVMNVWAGTGDWFGGWDGDREPEPDRYCNRDATAGQMVERIEKREPAVMLCHWPGLFSQGTRKGFHAFQRVIQSLESRFAGEIHWMKLSEIGRYYAAKEMADVRYESRTVHVETPVEAPNCTFLITGQPPFDPVVITGSMQQRLRQVSRRADLVEGSHFVEGETCWVCFRLGKGRTRIVI